jgi:hypothetical protein
MTDTLDMELVTTTAPETIWLQVSDDELDCAEPFPSDDPEGVTWCATSVLSCEVKYVRADTLAPLLAEIRRLDGLLDDQVEGMERG